jgi:predicted dehydrogenase
MKYLIAGFGSIGRRHFRNLLSLKERDIVLFRTYQSTLDDQETEGFVVETELSAALAHQPDGVIIANPTALHLDIAIPAAEQGCHILLEKPVSDSMEKLGRLQQIADKSGSRILVAFQFRYHPGLQIIRKWILEGEIGQVYYARAHWGEYLPDWHPWEDYRRSYSARKELGGGVLLTLCHPIDYLHWLLGPVDKVWATARQGDALGIDVEELVDLSLQFRNHVKGSIHLNYLQRPPRHKLEIIGSSGTIHWDSDSNLRIYHHQQGSWESHPFPAGFNRNDLFLREMEHFLDVVSGVEPDCTLDDGVEVQKIISAAYQSIETGKINPVL